MPIDDNTTFEISTDGQISDAVIERTRERIGRVGGHCREAITHVELRITDDLNHLDQAHAKAEATLVVKHGPVRAHARAATVSEATDLMIDRLRRRVDRHESKLHRIGTKRRDGVAAEGKWKHGDVDDAPRHAPPIASEDATVVRRKTFAAGSMSVEEAMFDIGILDHDFYLFEEADTGSTCLISNGPDGSFDLAVDGDQTPAVPEGATVNQTAGPIVIDKAGAQRLLSTGDDPFVFHRPAPDLPAQVLYRRYDGNFGVIELGETAGSVVALGSG